MFLYEADTERLRKAFTEGNEVAKNILQSYSKAEFFTKLPEIENEIKIVTYIAAEGDISTDLLSPGTEAHSRSDRELHGKCMISAEAQSEIQQMQKQHPDKRIMLIAEKGTMGVGSSRMSGVNNVALWTGKPGSPYVPICQYCTYSCWNKWYLSNFPNNCRCNWRHWYRFKKLGKKTRTDGNPVLDEMTTQYLTKHILWKLELF